MAPVQTTATITEREGLADGVARFRLATAASLPFAPGQYVDLRFPGETKYHAFSIASSPAEDGTVELLVKRVGPFTTRLFESPLGATLDLLGPLGAFLSRVEGDLVMIAGGVGVAPFLSKVRWARDGGASDREYWLFFSARTRKHLFYEEELRKLPEENPRVHVVFTLTRESPLGWDGELGRITSDFLKKRLGTLSGKTFAACGPVRMTESLKEQLLAAGVSPDRFTSESWG